MKKISKLALLAAATALLFGAIGCSDSEESGNGGNNGDGNEPEQVTPAPDGSGGAGTTSFTVDFVGLTGTDFTPAVTFASDGKLKLAAKSETKVGVATLYSRSEGNLIVRSDTNTGKCTGINYGGSSYNSNSSDGTSKDTLALKETFDFTDSSRHITVPVNGAGTLKVTYKSTYTASADGDVDKGQIGAYDKDGKLIGEVASVTGVNNDNPLTVEVSAATTVYILYARNGTTATKNNEKKASGGIDVTKIEFTAAE